MRLSTAAACILLCVLATVHALTVNWANPDDGDWSMAANWSPAVVPGSEDDAVISGNVTVTVGANIDVGTLTLNATTLRGINSARIALKARELTVLFTDSRARAALTGYVLPFIIFLDSWGVLVAGSAST